MSSSPSAVRVSFSLRSISAASARDCLSAAAAPLAAASQASERESGGASNDRGRGQMGRVRIKKRREINQGFENQILSHIFSDHERKERSEMPMINQGFENQIFSHIFMIMRRKRGKKYR
jgi:hypothetical protein